MKTRFLQMKAALMALTLFVMLAVAGITTASAQTFTVDNLNYSLNSDGASVTVTGHVNGTAATGELVIPESVEYLGVLFPVTEIGSYAFENCTGLTGSLVIPNSVVTINSYAFFGCTGFTGTLTIGNSVKKLSWGAFYNCGFTGTLYIPESLIDMTDEVFYHCNFTSLEYNAIDLENLTHTSTQYWHTGLNSISSVTIGDNVQRIPGYFLCDFANEIGSLVIPNNVTYIGNNAFNGCSGLSGNLTIGFSVTEIGNAAFFGACENITSYVFMPDTPPTLGNNAFASANYATPVSVHCGSVEAYQDADGWNLFTNYQELDPCLWMVKADLGDMAYGGTISGSGAGTYQQGQTCTLIATPNEGYRFVNWTENDEVFSTDATYQFSVTSDRDLMAHFTYDYDVAIGTEGTTTSYYPFSSCPYVLYQQIYTKEEIGGVGEINRMALFNIRNVSKRTHNCDIYLVHTEKSQFANSSDWVEVTAADKVFSGDVTLLYNDWTTITFDTPFTYNGTSNLVLVIDVNTGNNSQNDLYFRAYSTNNYHTLYKYSSSGDPVTINFDPCNPSQYSGNRSYTKDQTVFGFTSQLSYIVSASVSPEESGTVTGVGTYQDGATCTLTATPDADHVFSCWMENNTVVSTENECSFTVQHNTDLVAVFTSVAPISFADANVKALCVANWDTNDDGELSYTEAAAVTDLGEVFKDNDDITSFNELQYFTGLTTIGAGAFEWCMNLTSVIIPSSVTTIGNSAFYDCRRLTSIDIPANVANIGYSALSGCDAMASMTVAAGNTVYDSRNNCNGIIATATNTLLFGCKNTSIPNTVTSLGANAFSHCVGLTSINIPSSVTTIDNNAFYACSGLTTITVNSNNTVYDSRNNCKAIIKTSTNELIAGCKNTVIPNTVTSIGRYAFSYRYGSGSSYNITIPASVTSIGYGAYLGGYGIASITMLPEVPPTLGDDAFEYVNADIPVNVPCGAEDAYNAAAGWNNFTGIYADPSCYCTITLTSNPVGAGTLSGGGQKLNGQYVTITATPGLNSVFLNWTENNVVVSTNKSYTFMAETDRTFVANFMVFENHYTPVTGMEHNMNVTGTVIIDNEEQFAPTYEIGAFCNHECRGTVLPQEEDGHWVYFMTVAGEADDKIYFKLFDHSNDIEPVLYCVDTLSFAVDGDVDPYQFQFVTNLTQLTQLTAGWTWYSTYIEQTGIDGLGMLENSLSEYGLIIKNQTSYVKMRSDGSWMGTMQALDNETGYKIKVSEASTAAVSGLLVDDPSSHPITLTPGWNWIGYYIPEAQTVTSALSGLEPEYNDMIKDQDGFSKYYENNGWLPADFVLTPGKAYMYQSLATENKTLVYHQSRESIVKKHAADNYWTNNVHEFADNICLTAVVDIAGVEQRDENVELAAFVNGVSRGSAKLIYDKVTDRYFAMMTISGEDGDVVTFGVRDSRGMTNFDSDTYVVFKTDDVIGDIYSPLQIAFSGMDASAMSVYPNPVASGQNITLCLPEDEAASEVLIINILGEVVSHQVMNGNIVDGVQTAGAYVVRVICESGNVYNESIIVK